MPLYYPDQLYIVRKTATANIYYYDMQTNAMATATYYPATETFTTGSMVAARSIGGKNASLLVYQNATNKWFEFNPLLADMTPYAESWQYADGAAVVGDRICCMTTPDGVETIFFLQHSSTSMLKGICLDA